jgi:hypothetical protein
VATILRTDVFLSEDVDRAAGCEVSLSVESVMDCGANGQEALSGSGRFETLHLRSRRRVG